MREAGRTSLLSKRWRYVWAYIRYLNFDYEALYWEALEETESINKESSEEGSLDKEEPSDDESVDEEFLEEEENKYVSWVDQVVNSHKAPTIDIFKVEFDLGASRKEKIDNWLRFAAEKRVKRLELDVAPTTGTGIQLVYTFPSLPCCNSLTFLRLAHVHVSGEDLEKLLSDCPTLEDLSVTSSELLVDLKVAGQSLKLKYLTIICCFEIKHLEISAPNLKVFHYCGPKPSLNFKSIPKLAEVSIAGYYADDVLSDFLDLSSFISQIEVLTIHQLFHIKRMAEVFPICTRLKILNIKVEPTCDVQLFHLRFLLNACPFVHTFMLTMHKSGHKVKRTKRTQYVEACPHYELKILEIVEFVGWEVDTAFLMYLIKSAVSLEKMIIRPTLLTIRAEPCVEKRRKRAIEQAKMLRSKLKPGTTFQICD